jgi:predicted Fe-S protein YdhL (DUF1289 family)
MTAKKPPKPRKKKRVDLPCCVVCEADARSGVLFCAACQRSYDRWHGSRADDRTTASLIVWTANRVRSCW